MAWTDSRVTNWMDEYYEARPQLTPPPKGILGYDVPKELKPVLNKLVSLIENKS